MEQFVARHEGLVGPLAMPGIDRPLHISRPMIAAAAQEVSGGDPGSRPNLSPHSSRPKTANPLVIEVSLDETDRPQTPMELLLILAMVAEEGIPAQTIAPRFTGRFNKGVDYVGDVAEFRRQFEEDLAVVGLRHQGVPTAGEPETERAFGKRQVRHLPADARSLEKIRRRRASEDGRHHVAGGTDRPGHGRRRRTGDCQGRVSRSMGAVRRVVRPVCLGGRHRSRRAALAGGRCPLGWRGFRRRAASRCRMQGLQSESSPALARRLQDRGRDGRPLHRRAGTARRGDCRQRHPQPLRATHPPAVPRTSRRSCQQHAIRRPTTWRTGHGSFGWLDWAVVVAYFVGITLYGLWVARKTHTSGAYFLGDRKLPWWVMLAQSFSTGTHAEGPVLQAGATYASGFAAIWYQWKNMLITPFYWLVAPWYRRSQRTTVAEIIEDRYGRALGLVYTVFAITVLRLHPRRDAQRRGKGRRRGDRRRDDLAQRSGRGHDRGVRLVQLRGRPGRHGLYESGPRISHYRPLLHAPSRGVGGGGRLFGDACPPAGRLLRTLQPTQRHRRIYDSHARRQRPGGHRRPAPHGEHVRHRTQRARRARRHDLRRGIVKRLCAIGWALTGVIVAAMTVKLGISLKDPEEAFGYACLHCLGPGLVGLMVASIVAANMSACSTSW